MTPEISVSGADEAAATRIVRHLLLLTLGVGMAGTLTELLLLEHTADPWQWVPIVYLPTYLPSSK